MDQSKKPKRFYTDVTVVQSADGHSVELDGRVIKTPGRKPLVVAPRSLADAVAEEWQGQTDVIDMAAMPVTRLTQRAIDSAAEERGKRVEDILGFSNSDLLCYRATDPTSLVDSQTAEWQPLLDWAAAELGVVLEVTTALMVVEQPEASRAALRRHVEGLGDFELSGLGPTVALLGSVVLGLALHCGHIDADRALSLSLLDELWQAEKWGEDEEAVSRRRMLARDLGDLQNFLCCLK